MEQNYVDYNDLRPEQMIGAQETVLMHFPQRCRLNLGVGIVLYTPGFHPVPIKFADHPYLKAHGATRYTEPETQPAA